MSIIKKISKSNFTYSLAGLIASSYAKFVSLTSTIEVKGQEKLLKHLEQDKPIIMTAWHGRLYLLYLAWPKKFPLKALVSPHSDGMIISKTLQRFGITSILGSSNKNAKSSAINIFKSLTKEKTSVTIIPDGPRGPMAKAVISPIYFAKKTGAPIYPLTYASKKHKTLDHSWDKMIVPKPFSKITLIYDDPIIIPKDATEKEMEQYRIKLENSLNHISKEADIAVGIDPIKPHINFVKRNRKQEKRERQEKQKEAN